MATVIGPSDRFFQAFQPLDESFDPTALVPQPQQIRIYKDLPKVNVPKKFALLTDLQQSHSLNYLRDKLQEHGLTLIGSNESSKLDLHIRINPSESEKEQSYKLRILDKKNEIIGHDEAGIFNGIITLLQILEISPKKESFALLPQLDISDWPDFPNRGVLLDVSRDRMPTLETLMTLVDRLAKWKVNQLQLYMEHTFAYKGHEKVWKDASPLTPEDIKKLDAYCKSRFIELVPNQNSLAHMHRWIMHSDYAKYAESPSTLNKKKIKEENYEHEGNPGYSLCPTNPATLKLIKGLYDQLLPNFSSRQVNVGLDEPHDLAKGGERSQAIIDRVGVSQVFLEYLKNILSLIKIHGNDRLMQFWADFVLMDEEILDHLPKDVIPMVWGYEDGFPFELGKKFKDRDIRWYVCPSTCAWGSIGGRIGDEIRNLTQAANKGKAFQASGYLITDWGDNGHHQPLSVSYRGFLLGASLSWKVMPQEEVDKMDLPRLLDIHVFKDRSGQMGKIACQVGDLYRIAIKDKRALTGCSALLRLLVFNGNLPDKEVMNAVTSSGLTHVCEILANTKNMLHAVKMDGLEAETLRKEYTLVIEMLDFASRFGLELLHHPNIKHVKELPKASRQMMKERLKILLEQYETVWLLRDKRGDLKIL